MASTYATRAAAAIADRDPQEVRPAGDPDNFVGNELTRTFLLGISPYQADEGELIGKHPREVVSEVLSLKFRAQNPLKAIREKCLDCCCGNGAEVRKCVAVDCALWPLRMGTNPFRKKRELSDEQKRTITARLVQPA